MERGALRAQLRQRRQELSPQQQIKAGQRLAGVVNTLKSFQCSQRLAVYLANDGEISTEAIISSAWSQGKTCYLPVLLNGDHTPPMAFLRYQPDTLLQKNCYGIPEPCWQADALCPPEQLDLVLLPLTGFDCQGGRLGMGGGYYDRTFAFMKNQPASGPVLIGLAHECQKVSHLPLADWDIPMVGVATDSRYYHPEHGAMV